MSRTYIRLLLATLQRPSLAPALLRNAWTFRARDWFRRWPFLPLPPSTYMAWRLSTAYGDPGAEPPLGELERYLRWAASLRKQIGRSANGGPA